MHKYPTLLKRKNNLNKTDIEKKQAKYKLRFYAAAVIIVLICLGIGLFGYLSGAFESTEAFAALITKWGVWGYIGFVLLEAASIIVVVLPCSLGYPAATLAYGPLISFILNAIAAVSASIIIFFIVRTLGKPLVDSIMSKKDQDKYNKYLDKTPVFEKIFALTLFVPFLPDNGLCYLAGLSKMKAKKFILMVLFLKPWKILFYCYFFDVVIDKLTNLF